MDKLQVRQNYRNLWHTDLMHTIQADTGCEHRKVLAFYVFDFFYFLFFRAVKFFPYPDDFGVLGAACADFVNADCCFAFWW